MVNDLIGPFQVKSLGSHSYALTFIDDYNIITSLYFLKNKLDCFKKFVHFKYLVENQIDYKIKMLIFDNGGEYISNEFHEFCSNVGIKCQFSISYTRRKNGVAKRKNRSLMDMTRCMLGDFLKFLWVEVVNTIIYILNRCLTKVVDEKSPFEAWIGKKPIVSHFVIFGCVAYSFVVSKKRKKLENGSNKCIFVGYDDHHKAYRLYCPFSR